MVGWIGSTSPREEEYSLMASLEHAMNEEESRKTEENLIESFLKENEKVIPKLQENN